jgi:hypothetical protein
LAGALYAPLYLSLQWALAWRGAIPEGVTTHTSVTTRPTRVFTNGFGRFEYRTIKPALFHGFSTETMDGMGIRVASAEKALFDLWYLEAGEWDESRHESLRLEPGVIDSDALSGLVEACGSPRLARARDAFIRYAQVESWGRVEL